MARPFDCEGARNAERERRSGLIIAQNPHPEAERLGFSQGRVARQGVWAASGFWPGPDSPLFFFFLRWSFFVF